MTRGKLALPQPLAMRLMPFCSQNGPLPSPLGQGRPHLIQAQPRRLPLPHHQSSKIVILPGCLSFATFFANPSMHGLDGDARRQGMAWHGMGAATGRRFFFSLHPSAPTYISIAPATAQPTLQSTFPVALTFTPSDRTLHFTATHSEKSPRTYSAAVAPT